MISSPVHLALRLEDDRFRPCAEYIFNLLARLYGYKLTVLDGRAHAPADALALIDYTSEPNQNPSPRIAPKLSISRSSFFTDEVFGRSPNPPTETGQFLSQIQGNAFATMAQWADNHAVLYSDPIAVAFFFLSGYHDFVSDVRDQYGRVLASHINVPAETWDVPVANHLCRQLHELISVLVGREVPKASLMQEQTVCLTHDIDRIRKYRGVASLKQAAGRIVGKPGSALAEMKAFAKTTSGGQRDPFDSIDRLYPIKERISAHSTFFLMANQGNRDADYKLNDQAIRSFLAEARSFGDEIGLHPSWETPGNAARLAQEKKALADATGTEPEISRQHYLRFKTPDTWRHLADLGFRGDSSGGFPDRAGFKYGWSGCFEPFDLRTFTTLPIVEMPLICMDMTLANYEKIPAELALERLSKLLDASCDNVPGGAFVFLWHNTIADVAQYPGYWDVFEYFFSVASGSARYITLGQLLKEYQEGRPA